MTHAPWVAADAYTRFIAGVVFPLQERLKHHTTVAVRTALEESQWWNRERLAQFQNERLQRLISDVAQHVPFYRELFTRLGLDPRDIRNAADLARLPFLTKDVIRANSDALKSERAQHLSRFNTGGSTGAPLIFYIGAERVSHDVAAKWRATRWWGVDIGDPEIVVWGSPIELGSQDRVRLLRDKLMRTKLLPAFNMGAARLDEHIAAIRAMRPRMVFGYPSSLAFMAHHAEATGQRLDDLGIKVTFVTSERLYDEQRAVIQRVFGCPVANGYGGRDAGFIAHQCPRGGMHLTAEDIIVEIVDAQGQVLPPGVAGEIVVTHLATRDYPFIRYRTGDVAVLDDSTCACGRGLPMLREIQGRTTDFVVAADGTVMHGLALIYVIRDLHGVQQFKIVQESLTHTRVLLVTDATFDTASLATIEAGIQARLGREVRVEIERVNDIPRERSGKFRYIVSHVKPGGVAA